MFPGNDIVSSLIAVQMGGTGGGVISLHDLFLQQETIVEVPLIGDYKQIFKWLPDNTSQMVNYQYIDYTNSTPAGHLFALWQIAHYKPAAIGMYRGEEYLGISMGPFGMHMQCYTIYSPNSDNTVTFLSQEDTLKQIYDYTPPEIISYNYSTINMSPLYFRADIERKEYDESGNLNARIYNAQLTLSGFGQFATLVQPYADSDHIAACIDEYARLCNAKYHELN